jgi:hypothetical protein
MKELSLKQRIQRALDIAEVQNVMSKHAYYHGAGYHLQELAEIWVKEDGPHAATASFGQNHGYWVGMKRIRQYYGELNEKVAPHLTVIMSTTARQGLESPWSAGRASLAEPNVATALGMRAALRRSSDDR